MSSRSAGRTSAARSAHSSSVRRVGRSSQPSSASSLGPPGGRDRHARAGSAALVDLHQREGRARHLERGVADESRMRARANAVLPAPRSPDSVTGRRARGVGDVDHQARVASSSASATVKLNVPEVLTIIESSVQGSLSGAAACTRPVSLRRALHRRLPAGKRR